MKRLGIDIGSTTVKVAVIDEEHNILFSEYKRHFANIKETLKELVEHASKELGNVEVAPTITGSGGLALAPLPTIWEFLLLRRLLQFLPLCRSWHQRQMLPSNLAARMPRSFILQTVWNSV